MSDPNSTIYLALPLSSLNNIEGKLEARLNNENDELAMVHNWASTFKRLGLVTCSMTKFDQPSERVPARRNCW